MESLGDWLTTRVNLPPWKSRILLRPGLSLWRAVFKEGLLSGGQFRIYGNFNLEMDALGRRELYSK